MKIVVLNGSPKGMVSVTMQYIHYIQKKFSQHELKIITITPRIKNIEKDPAVFQEILDEIQSSDGVIWGFPVYYQLVPSNYKRFIELILINGVEDIFKNKYTAVLTTSVHYYDHTSHNYMEGICNDLDMKYVGSFSADMYDLEKKIERENLLSFAENFFEEINNKTVNSKNYNPLIRRDFVYAPGKAKNKVDPGNKKILIVSDSQDKDKNLIGMIDKLRSTFSKEIELINLYDLEIKGSCLGCIQCGYDNHCFYEGKDEYIDFYKSKVMKADILIFAGSIQDRYLSSRWKLYFDRSFFKNHVPTLTGIQVGIIISGPLNQVPNLRQILHGYSEMSQAHLAGFITDEFGDSEEIDNQIETFAKRLVRYANQNYVKPLTFLGIGGRLIFRDEIWARLRFPFRADHKVYKKRGFYNFPQKKYKMIFKNKFMLMMSVFPVFRKEVNKRLIEQILKPLKKVIEK